MEKKWIYAVSGQWIWWQKMLFFMSRIAFFMLVGIMQVSASVFSQNKSFSIKMENVSLVEVLNEVTRQTGYDFLYNYDVVRTKGHVDVDASQVKVNDFLSDLLKKHGLEFEMQDQVIVVRAVRSAALPQVVQKKITGVVKDSKGEPLPGVTVLIKGTSLGTATDTEGRFTLSAVGDNKPVLTFSFIGMKVKEMVAYADKPLSVVLEDDVSVMDEVVVAGYFNKSKESFTGSEVTVKAEDLKKVGSLNVIQALSAFDPSIRLAENLEYGSDPNRIPEITVRGENGFDLRSSADDAQTNPNAPLYVLDGVEVSAQRVYDLDMNRIDQMTILKDATATALYGSRGANGVIVITTLRPKSGEIKVNVNANFNVSIPDLRDYNLMNAEEKLRFEQLAGVYKENTYEDQMEADMKYNARLQEVKRGVNTYWLSQPLQRALNQRYSLNFEGGDKSFRYGIDLRYDGDKGVMKESGRQKYGIGVIFNYNIGENFFIRNDVMVDNVKGDNSPYGSFSTYTRQNPYDRIYDKDGMLVNKLSSTDYNPLVNATMPNFDQNGYTSIQDNFNVDWRIIESLRLQGRFSYTKQQNKSEVYKSPKSAEFASEEDLKKKGSYYMSHSNSDQMDGNVTLAFFKNIGKGVFNLGVGTNMTGYISKGDYYRATGFASETTDFIGAAIQFEDKSKPRGSYDKSRMVGFFGNLNYGYDNRYFVDLSYRTDGSSKFGANSRFAPFWAAGVAWNVHNESFWNKDNTKNFLKVRASMGSTGSVNFSSTQALTTYIYDFDSEYNGIFGANFNEYGNPDLKWQTTRSYNVGLDWGFFNGRVQLNADAYMKVTDNLLLPIDIAPSTGFTSYVENLGEVKNTGVEGRLRVDILDNRAKDLNWNVTLAAFSNRNRIQKLSNQLEKMNQQAVQEAAGIKPLRRYETGRSQSALMVVQSGGIDPATGNEVYIKRDGTRTFDYDPNDVIVAGDMMPKVEGTLNSNLNWKGFNLYMLFRYKWGGKIYNSTLATKVEGANPYYNADKRALYDRWQNPGDEVFFRRIDQYNTPYQTTRLVMDDDLFTLESISLSYDLPLKFAKVVYADRVKFLISTTNVFRISTIAQERGTQYPFARTFSVGLNVAF